MNVLLTGGLGYIGSHTAAALIAAGHAPVLLDNLANAGLDVLDRIAAAAGARPPFVHADVRDTDTVARVLVDHRVDAVIHFAGLKAVGESVRVPLAYFDVNVGGALSLLRAMEATGVRKFIFSSSATVYGAPQYLPFDEAHPTAAINPYGRTKLHVEEVLMDLTAAGGWRAMTLRYFNPVGAHPSGLLGERPNGAPNNLMPFVAQVAAGERPYVEIFGDDYDTPDGTGVRDYIHVMDLAEGHVAALGRFAVDAPGFEAFNLGTGRGYSVREMIAAFAAAAGREIPARVVARRPGDLPCYYADPARAERVLGWRARRGLAEMCESAWRFQSRGVTDTV
ncbi:UDP-galactose-4-epimerase [uncultured Alphaproteobacteria bacterium]|uniref:UDP-glucose 4-epimerase n=1 Tax=uncultured Alphaproteobacteria bacterium TaxID=91750 RepID=A0A212KD47_9PROT|nr:UDP-galactose-4-epimerase [uncultured Alphaproteobacteria bacterium]